MRLLPFIVSFFCSVTSFANVFGPDNRTVINSHSHTLFHVVKIVAAAMELCSGVLIREDLVLTASHCILPAVRNPKESTFGVPVANVPSAGIEVVYGFYSNQSVAMSDVRRVYLGLGSLDHYKTEYFRDFAILQLRRPLGKKYGFMDIDSTSAATAYNTKDLRISGYDIRQSILDPHGHPIFVLNQTTNAGCSIRNGFPNGAIYHDCNTELGASGAPLMKCVSEESCRVVGINVAEQRNGGSASLHLPEYSEKYTNYAINLITVASILKLIDPYRESLRFRMKY